jgi:hypothetical protein
MKIYAEILSLNKHASNKKKKLQFAFNDTKFNRDIDSSIDILQSLSRLTELIILN